MTSVSPCIALFGVGYWGRNLARAFSELGALKAVVDSNPATAQEIGSKLTVDVREAADVLADPHIAGIAIATRAETHFALTRDALHAGKHVFVEKPLVMDETEADELIDLAEAKSRVLMVGHLLRYHPLFRRLLEIVHSGELGALRYAYSDRMSLGKIRTEENVLWSFAPHDISMLLALTGEEPDHVSAQGTAFISPGIADWATVQLWFPSGIRADIRVSWLHYKKVQRIAAVCEKGTIIFEDSEPDWSRKLFVQEHEVRHESGMPVPHRGERRAIEVAQGEPLKLECAHFIECIAKTSRPLTDAAEGRAVLRVLQRAAAAMAA